MQAQASNRTLSVYIDEINGEFISDIKRQLRNLSEISSEALIWLMIEHYQFSEKNCTFLRDSMKASANLDKEIYLEFKRNLSEENGHYILYEKALRQIGIDVHKRITFNPTSDFFLTLSSLIIKNSFVTVGAIYATETAAIFEHEIFWKISNELSRRIHFPWERSKLKIFHDLHLNGVEQGHKDGLEKFINDYSYLEEKNILKGAQSAIEAMVLWWKELLSYARQIH